MAHSRFTQFLSPSVPVPIQQSQCHSHQDTTRCTCNQRVFCRHISTFLILFLECLGADDIGDTEGGGDDGASGDFAGVSTVIRTCCGEDYCVRCYSLCGVRICGWEVGDEDSQNLRGRFLLGDRLCFPLGGRTLDMLLGVWE